MMLAALLALATLAIPPLPKSYVTDPAGVLSVAKANHLEDELHQFEDDSDDYVIVWIGTSPRGVPVEKWAAQVTAAWKIGQTDNDTGGAVLFVFTDTHRVQIVTTGDATVLTAARAAQIADSTIRPGLAAGRADDAVQSGIEAMLDVIDPPEDAPTPKPASKPKTAAAATPVPAVRAVAAAAAIVQATRPSRAAPPSSTTAGPLAALREHPRVSDTPADSSEDVSGEVPIPPAPAYFVTDNAHAISAATQEQLENELEAFARKTTDQVVVWIGESTGDTPLEEWTIKAAQSWGVGQRGKDNGVVLFVFMKDRKLRIEVGYGLEATLTDATAAQILRDSIEPAMRSGNADEAVTDGVAGILHAIDTDSAPPRTRFHLFQAISSVFRFIFQNGGFALEMLIVGAFFLLVIAACVGVILNLYADIFDWAKTGKADQLHADFKSDDTGGGGDGRMNFTGPYFSGGGGWGGGGGGGGGFSGGGGSFGGGGASGGW